jgi:hypothetical protein
MFGELFKTAARKKRIHAGVQREKKVLKLSKAAKYNSA